MTLPFFGRSWTLVNEKQNGVGAPAKGPGRAGLYTLAPGKLGYNEVFELILKILIKFNMC